MKTLVLGIGNTLLTDEGIGIHVLQALEPELANWPDVTLLDGGTLSFTLNALWRLLAASRKTQKRVNALKYNIIPRYQATVQHICAALEEDERNTLFQIKVLRARKPA